MTALLAILHAFSKNENFNPTEDMYFWVALLDIVLIVTLLR